MSVVTAGPINVVAGPRFAAESLRGMLLWLTGLAGAFVFIEPSPYEFVAIITILLFVLTGASVRAEIAPLVLLLVLMNVGYAIAVVPVSEQTKPVTWVLISIFLAVTAIFYAAMLGTNTQRRLELLMRGYLAAALIASLVAGAAYFRLFGDASDIFVLYGRARGTFNDPNVLGAFLVLPALLVFQRMLAGRLAVRSALMLLIMLVSLFLTFSRGAWAQFAFAGTVLMAVTFVTSRSVNERFRVVLVAIGGILVIAVLVTALLSLGQVSELFSERATLEQSYDIGRYGRFGRYMLGAEVALDHPLGIGPLQFYRFFTEDPHNTFLNTFMSGGWLAGFGYLTLSAVTLAMSTRFLFVRTPWQPVYHAIYAAYVGVIGESIIIDIDHWRHYFLILGVLWGLMAASNRYRSTAPAGVLIRNAAA
jgi:O-antigen ligase/polysaccharide polymerase Wzy-like membrane protein